MLFVEKLFILSVIVLTKKVEGCEAMIVSDNFKRGDWTSQPLPSAVKRYVQLRAVLRDENSWPTEIHSYRNITISCALSVVITAIFRHTKQKCAYYYLEKPGKDRISVFPSTHSHILPLPPLNRYLSCWKRTIWGERVYRKHIAWTKKEEEIILGSSVMRNGWLSFMCSFFESVWSRLTCSSLLLAISWARHNSSSILFSRRSRVV